MLFNHGYPLKECHVFKLKKYTVSTEGHFCAYCILIQSLKQLTLSFCLKSNIGFNNNIVLSSLIVLAGSHRAHWIDKRKLQKQQTQTVPVAFTGRTALPNSKSGYTFFFYNIDVFICGILNRLEVILTIYFSYRVRFIYICCDRAGALHTGECLFCGCLCTATM